MTPAKVILIVDDDPDDIIFFSEAVAELDGSIECVAARGGEEAIQLLNGHPKLVPDFIFLDLNMPRMNGKECLNHLKSDKELCAIPVIIYTTSKSTDDAVETTQMGAICFLTKPNKFSDLKTALQQILEGTLEKMKEINQRTNGNNLSY